MDSEHLYRPRLSGPLGSYGSGSRKGDGGEKSWVLSPGTVRANTPGPGAWALVWGDLYELRPRRLCLRFEDKPKPRTAPNPAEQNAIRDADPISSQPSRL